jgi:hypothetical protein
MKRRTLANYLLGVLFILAGLGGLGVELSKMGAARRPSGAAKQAATQSASIPDNRSLREKAKDKGRYTGYEPPRKAKVSKNLEGLTKSSSGIIIGIPQDNISVLSADGRTITLDYKVRVMYVYKGALREQSTITVSLPGGRVAFEDGSTAEIRTSWLKKMMNGKAYALFLTESSRPGIFVTTGEAQGIFEIPKMAKDNPVIQTHSGLRNDPIGRYQNTDARQFLKELRRVTGKDLKHSFGDPIRN